MRSLVGALLFIHHSGAVPSWAGNQTWLDMHGIVCPNENPADCDNKGACGICLMELPRSACNFGYGGSLTDCSADIPFGELCEAGGGQGGGGNLIEGCGSRNDANNCFGGFDVFVRVYCHMPPSSPLPPGLPPQPPAPPPGAPAIIIIALGVGLGGGVGSFFVLVLLAVLYVRWKKKRAARAAFRRSEAAREIIAEHTATVLYAVRSLPTRTWTRADAGVELANLGGAATTPKPPPSTNDPSESSERSGVSNMMDSIGGFFSGRSGDEPVAEPAAPAAPTAPPAPMAKTKYDDVECAICMTPFEEGELLRVLPCGHSFRVTCIDEWLIRKGRADPTGDEVVKKLAGCPLCKKIPIEVADAPTIPHGPVRPRRGGTSQTV